LWPNDSEKPQNCPVTLIDSKGNDLLFPVASFRTLKSFCGQLTQRNLQMFKQNWAPKLKPNYHADVRGWPSIHS